MKFLCIIILGLTSHSIYSFKVDKTEDKFYDGDLNGTVLDLPAHINMSGSLPELHIVGGVPATPHEFPWLVHLNAGGSFCGGSLIELNLVLTAAHCLQNDKGVTVPAGRVSVVAGDHSRSGNERTEQQVTASGVYLHENYNYPRAYANDIALIRLSRNLNRTAQVRPISLPTRGPAFSTRGTVAGWGSTVYGGQITDTLRKVTVPIVTGTTCSKQMTNPTGQFCAGEGGKDSCQGDSGGPFICLSSPTEICGVVSYGEGCATPGYPGVYTNVMEYVSWINKNRDFVYSTASIDVVASKILVMISFYFSMPLFFR